MKPEWIARQSSGPSGWIGEIVARVMSFETAPANRAALETLAVQPSETVLEIGCGHGRTLARLASYGACVVGIDPSEVMVRLARRRARRWIKSGRADVTLASSAKIPHTDRCFDAALAMHVVYFWREALADLREVHRVLRTGGRLLLGYRARDGQTLASLPASVYVLRSVAEIEELLAEAGFAGIRSVERSGFQFTSGLRDAG